MELIHIVFEQVHGPRASVVEKLQITCRRDAKQLVPGSSLDRDRFTSLPVPSHLISVHNVPRFFLTYIASSVAVTVLG
jgi:hypothetical protein